MSDYDRLSEIITHYPEKEYNKTIAQEKNWAILRSLSHIRTNLIQWLPIQKTDKVLEIGADTGALTGVLSELSASVTATETSKEAHRILEQRYTKNRQIQVIQGSFETLKDKLEKDYDWILLADSFEKAGRQMSGNDPHKALLSTVKEHLSENGKVVVACANRLGLKYFAGSGEETGRGYFQGIEGYQDKEKEKTFSEPELIDLARECGYPSLQMYYPYPDATLPMSIYSDEYLPKPGELWDNRRNFHDERYVLFDEGKAFDNIIKDGLFPVFSNAFLVILSKKEEKQQERLIFTKYSNERSRDYSIRTDILRRGEERIARKVACFPEGAKHVDNLLIWQEKLGKVYKDTGITLNRAQKGLTGVEMEYLRGETFEEHLDNLLSQGKVKDALDQFLSYIHTVEKAGSQKRFVMTEQFSEVFGARILPPELMCSDVTDLDMVAGNVILAEDSYIHMDYEWTFDFPVPVRFVLYRIIQNYLYGNVKRERMEREWLYKRIGLTDLEIEQYTRMEESFQKYIVKQHTPLRLLYDAMTPGCISFAAEEEHRKEEAAKNVAANTGIEIFIDSFEIAMTGIYVYGWAVSKAERKVTFSLLDSGGKELEVVKTDYLYRKDVADHFKLSGKNSYAGFLLQCRLPDAEATKEKMFTLICRDGKTEVPFAIPVGKLRLKQSKLGKKIMDLRGAKDVIQYIAPKDMGFLSESEQYRVENQRFDTWRMAHRLSEVELVKQRAVRFAVEPFYTVFILPGKDNRSLKHTIQSVKKQTYSRYEIIRSSYQNASEKTIKGEYIFFLEAGDLFTPNALYEFTRVLNQGERFDMIYCDSDQIDAGKKEYFDPMFKPDYAPVTLESGNYIGNSICFSRELLEKAGYPNDIYGKQTIYDLILRCSELTTKVGHISTILYHRSNPMERSQEELQELAGEWEMGRNILKAHFERTGTEAEIIWAKEPLCYTVKKKVSGTPKVSVIIPNQDHTADLEKCLSSIYGKTAYDNYEILVVENNSHLQETFTYYEEMKKRYPKVSLLYWDKMFNYSAINNFAVQKASGDYFLFLNNDTEVLTCDWMERMLASCQAPGVGIVGCRLYYPDGTLQHAGVILGLGSIAGHLFVKEPGNISGYMGKVVLKQNLSAVTAACMMCSREVFEKVKGFDEYLQVALNDVDFCMKCRKAGYMVVYDPDVELYHYESKSRGLDTTPEKKARYDGEVAVFTERWREELENGDPFYNVNLSRTTWNCTFRIPRKS